MNKQTVAVAIVVKAGIVESIRLSNDFNKLRHTVLEEMAKEHGYESSETFPPTVIIRSRLTGTPSMMLSQQVGTLLLNASR
jgi:hypothetical protein